MPSKSNRYRINCLHCDWHGYRSGDPFKDCACYDGCVCQLKPCPKCGGHTRIGMSDRQWQAELEKAELAYAELAKDGRFDHLR